MCRKSKIERALHLLTQYPFWEKMMITQLFAQKIMKYSHLDFFPDETRNTALPWELETFAQLSIIATENNPRKSFNTNGNKDFYRIITAIRNYMPPYLEKNKNARGFANDFFMVAGMLQFKPQKNILNRMFRYDFFWAYRDDTLDMAKIFSENYNGLEYNDFIELAILVFFVASMEGNLSQAFYHIVTTRIDVVRTLTITREEYIARQNEKNAGDINNAVYGFNYLFPYPFLEFNGNIFMPVPYLIVDAVCESLLTRATNENPQLREIIGKNVAQAYIENILNAGNVYEEVLPETQYRIGKQNIDSPDIMIKDKNRFCFIDSKLSTPKLSLRTFNEKDIEANVALYAKNVRQIYNRIKDFISKKYYPFSVEEEVEKADVYGIVIVFENAYIFKERILQKVFQDLKINRESEEATYIKSNIYITDLSDLESLVFSSYNIFNTLQIKRDDPKSWNDMGLYSDSLYQSTPKLLPQMQEFENKARSILRENIKQLLDLNLIPNKQLIQ